MKDDKAPTNTGKTKVAKEGATYSTAADVLPDDDSDIFDSEEERRLEKEAADETEPLLKFRKKRKLKKRAADRKWVRENVGAEYFKYFPTEMENYPLKENNVVSKHINLYRYSIFRPRTP